MYRIVPTSTEGAIGGPRDSSWGGHKHVFDFWERWPQAPRVGPHGPAVCWCGDCGAEWPEGGITPPTCE